MWPVLVYLLRGNEVKTSLQLAVWCSDRPVDCCDVVPCCFTNCDIMTLFVDDTSSIAVRSQANLHFDKINVEQRQQAINDSYKTLCSLSQVHLHVCLLSALIIITNSFKFCTIYKTN